MDDYDDTFGYLANNHFHISFTYLTLYEIVFNKTIGNKLNRIRYLTRITKSDHFRLRHSSRLREPSCTVAYTAR